MKVYEGCYKTARIKIEETQTKINLVINGKVLDTINRGLGLKEIIRNYTLQSVIVIDGEELVVVAQIETKGHLFPKDPEVYVGNTKIPIIKVS